VRENLVLLIEERVFLLDLLPDVEIPLHEPIQREYDFYSVLYIQREEEILLLDATRHEEIQVPFLLEFHLIIEEHFWCIECIDPCFEDPLVNDLVLVPIKVTFYICKEKRFKPDCIIF